MWRILGTVKPSLEWIVLETPTLSETFRISYSGIDPYFNSVVFIRQYFANDEVLPVSKTYPKSEKLILEMQIPQAFKNDGLVIRYLGVKRSFRKKYGRFYPFGNWQLTIEEWI